MTATGFLEPFGRLRRSTARQSPRSELTFPCRVSRTIGWLLTGRQQMLCSILHLHGWYRLAAITDLVCYHREGMSFHCARMAEMDARLERIERRRSTRAVAAVGK